QSDAAGAGKAVPHQLSRAGEEAGGKFLDLRLHGDGAVFVDPTAGFDVDLLPGAELQFQHVPEAVEPEDPVALRSGEGVDEKTRAGEQHIGKALHAVEGVVQLVGRGQELMFADVE